MNAQLDIGPMTKLGIVTYVLTIVLPVDVLPMKLAAAVILEDTYMMETVIQVALQDISQTIKPTLVINV